MVYLTISQIVRQKRCKRSCKDEVIQNKYGTLTISRPAQVPVMLTAQGVVDQRGRV